MPVDAVSACLFGCIEGLVGPFDEAFGGFAGQQMGQAKAGGYPNLLSLKLKQKGFHGLPKPFRMFL